MRLPTWHWMGIVLANVVHPFYFEKKDTAITHAVRGMFDDQNTCHSHTFSLMILFGHSFFSCVLCRGHPEYYVVFGKHRYWKNNGRTTKEWWQWHCFWWYKTTLSIYIYTLCHICVYYMYRSVYFFPRYTICSERVPTAPRHRKSCLSSGGTCGGPAVKAFATSPDRGRAGGRREGIGSTWCPMGSPNLTEGRCNTSNSRCKHEVTDHWLPKLPPRMAEINSYSHPKKGVTTPRNKTITTEHFWNVYTLFYVTSFSYKFQPRCYQLARTIRSASRMGRRLAARWNSPLYMGISRLGRNQTGGNFPAVFRQNGNETIQAIEAPTCSNYTKPSFKYTMLKVPCLTVAELWREQILTQTTQA